MTVFDRIQTMPKDELQKLIYYIYLWGHLNEQCNVDDEYFYQKFLDLPASHIDSVINSFDNLQPVKVREVPIEGGTPRYLSTKFFSVEDAAQYLTKNILGIVKVDNTTYATSTTIYKLLACDGGKLS